jgi:hypothetical protein
MAERAGYAFGSQSVIRTTIGRTLGCRRSTRRRRPIEHDLAGGAELLFVPGKAARHPPYIGDGVLAEPHHIRRAGIRILLRVGEGWERSYDCDE